MSLRFQEFGFDDEAHLFHYFLLFLTTPDALSLSLFVCVRVCVCVCVCVYVCKRERKRGEEKEKGRERESPDSPLPQILSSSTELHPQRY